jgi:hypothetical protein
MVCGLNIINSTLNQLKKIPDMQTTQLEHKGLDTPTNRYFNKEWYSSASFLCGFPREKSLFYFPGILFEEGASIVTGWTARVQFPGGGRDFCLLHSVQTGSGAHPASCTMGMGSFFLRGKAAGDVKVTSHLHLVPKSRMVELYPHFPIQLHGVVLN